MIIPALDSYLRAWTCNQFRVADDPPGTLLARRERHRLNAGSRAIRLSVAACPGAGYSSRAGSSSHATAALARDRLAQMNISIRNPKINA